MPTCSKSKHHMVTISHLISYRYHWYITFPHCSKTYQKHTTPLFVSGPAILIVSLRTCDVSLPCPRLPWNISRSLRLRNIVGFGFRPWANHLISRHRRHHNTCSHSYPYLIFLNHSNCDRWASLVTCRVHHLSPFAHTFSHAIIHSLTLRICQGVLPNTSIPITVTATIHGEERPKETMGMLWYCHHLARCYSSCHHCHTHQRLPRCPLSHHKSTTSQPRWMHHSHTVFSSSCGQPTVSGSCPGPAFHWALLQLPSALHRRGHVAQGHRGGGRSFGSAKRTS